MKLSPADVSCGMYTVSQEADLAEGHGSSATALGAGVAPLPSDSSSEISDGSIFACDSSRDVASSFSGDPGGGLLCEERDRLVCGGAKLSNVEDVYIPDMGMQAWEDFPEEFDDRKVELFGSAYVRVVEDAIRPSPAERSFGAKALFARQDALRSAGRPRLAAPLPSPSSEVQALLPFIAAARRRRPAQILQYGENPLAKAGVFWDLEDFKPLRQKGELGTAVWDLLVKCRRAEDALLQLLASEGRVLGEQVHLDGCRQIGMPEHVVRSLEEGVELPFSALPDAPAQWKPYPGMFVNGQALKSALTEFNRLLDLGKLIPLSVLAFIESPTTMIEKESDTEPGGFKYRLCLDMSASGVNFNMIKLDCPMVDVESFISTLPPGAWLSKQDLQDFFLIFKIHPKYLTFFGLAHPVTGQTYVYAFLPFGCRASPPLACSFMTHLTRAAAEELRARERGEAGRRVFAHIPIAPRPPDLDHSRNRDPVDGKSALFVTACSSLCAFVDDHMDSAVTEPLGLELVAILGVIFAVTGMHEKIAKREMPSQLKELLGLLFDSVQGRLSLPPKKRAKLLQLVSEVIAVLERGGVLSIQELASLVGKLQHASQAFVGAGFFLFDLRAPLNLVMHLLPRVKQRRGFLVSAEDMPRAFQDLKMWSDLLSSELGERRFLVTPDGLFGVWRWQEGFGEGALPSGIFYAATDASKRAGGITFDGNRRVHDFKGDQVAGFWHINLLETAMGLQFVVQFGSQVAGQVGVLWCDNKVAVSALNSGRSKNKIIAGMAREFKLRCLELSLQLHVVWIPTLKNLEADAISRGALGHRIADWSLNPEIMARWRRAVGGEFDVDMFASPSGVNAQAELFCSSSSPQSFDFLPTHRVWAFPPPSLAGACLREALQWDVAVVLLVVPRAFYEECECKDSWKLLRCYSSDERQLNYFQRPVQGLMKPCRTPGYDMVVLCRAIDSTCE